MPASNKNYLHGFTLVEMAVVLVIVALIIGGLMMPLSAQVDQQRYNETTRDLEDAKEALLGYAMSHKAVVDGRPYLPCPDTDNNGVEEVRNGVGVCPSQEGRLPWTTLGLNRGDAWGNLIRYRVHFNFSNSQNGITLSPVASVADFRICESSACAVVIATRVPVVLVSHGKNGYGAISEQLTVNAVPAGISADEMENIDGRNNPTAGNANVDTADTADVDFVSTFSSANFDDVVTWLSPNILFNRMVAAGQLP